MSVDLYVKNTVVAAAIPVKARALLTGLVGFMAIASWPTCATAWADPLSVRPPVLDTGKALPGDAEAVLCAELDNVPHTTLLNGLTLAQAVDMAVCHNPQVQSAWAAIKLQSAALGEARAAYLPTASFSASRVNDNTHYPNTALPSTVLHSNTLYASLSWRLWDAGTRHANESAAQALLGAALASHDAVLQRTLNAVISAYFEAQTARATWEARQKTRLLAQQTLATAQRRASLGAGSQTDTLQAATAAAKASLEQERAQGAYRKALSVLVYALGIPVAATATTATPLVLAVGGDERGDGRGDVMADAPGVALLQRGLFAWLQEAQDQHPALVAARAQLQAAQNKATASAAEGLPSLDLTGNLYQNGRPNQGLSPTKTREGLVQLTLMVPVFEGFARTYKVKGAQALVEQREAELTDTAHQVLMEVVKAHADATTALENLGASQTLLDAAQLALASVQRKFDRGATDVLEMLSAQAALADAQLERVRCVADWRSATLRLLASAGGLGRLGVAAR